MQTEEINRFLNYLKVEKGFSENTISAYRNDLNQLADFAGEEAEGQGIPPSWEGFGRQGVLSYLLNLKERGYSATTRARKMASANSFFSFMKEEGLIKKDELIGKIGKDYDIWVSEFSFGADEIREKQKELIKIHDLVILGRKAGMPKPLINKCEKLSREYTESRYGIITNEIPSNKFSDGDAINFLEIAKEVVEWAKKTLKS